MCSLQLKRPHVYILGRGGSSEVDQLVYVNTRRACLLSLDTKITTSNGVEITDMVPVRNLRLENRKGDVSAVVVMQGSTNILQSLFHDLILLFQIV